jgi:hypothetical protein
MMLKLERACLIFELKPLYSFVWKMLPALKKDSSFSHPLEFDFGLEL